MAPNNLEKRCQLLTLYNGVGRGGEIKFQQYADWVFDHRFEMTDISWAEAKLLQTYCMLIPPNYQGYYCDWYHAIGCFYAVERGLYRANGKSTGVSDFMFPSLHKLRETSIARSLTNVIRDNLPKSTPAKLKNSYSSKSVRKGGIGEMSMHSDVSFNESVIRSGHSTGTNQDHYVNWNNFELSSVGGLGINYWEDAHGKVYPPCLSCLSSKEISHAMKMIEQLFLITHTDFLPDGVLRPVLIWAFAALLMYYAQTAKDCGLKHVLTVCMLNAAIKANVTSDKSNDAHNVLMEWSDIIYKDFRQRNSAKKFQKTTR